jgi:hypothetical protein
LRRPKPPVSPIAFAIRRLAFENHARKASELRRIELAPDSEPFTGNGPVAFQGEQEIGRSGSVMRGAEDFVLIFL